MSHRPILTVTFAAAALVALAAPAPAHAQFGKILKKAAEKVAVDKAVDKATGSHGDSSATAQTPADAPQGAAPAGRGGRRITRGGGAAAAPVGGAIDDALVQKIVAYHQAYVAAYDQVVTTDPRFRAYQTARADYERCYAKNLGYEKAMRRYARLAEQARLDDNMNAYAKWSDSLNTTRVAQLKGVPAGGCVIPEMDSGLAQAASESAAKAAEAKTGTNGNALSGMSERLRGALALSAEDRQQAIKSGAYKAEELAVIDRNKAALQAWTSHADGEPVAGGANEQAVTKYYADMDRYRDARDTYDKCSQSAQEAGGTPQMPASMQAQMMSVKPPTEAQQKEMERMSKLGEAAHKRGDDATAMAYADSIQKIMGIKMSPQASADGAKYARDLQASQEKARVAQKKCGLPPEEPIKPAYVR